MSTEQGRRKGTYTGPITHPSRADRDKRIDRDVIGELNATTENITYACADGVSVLEGGTVTQRQHSSRSGEKARTRETVRRERDREVVGAGWGDICRSCGGEDSETVRR